MQGINLKGTLTVSPGKGWKRFQRRRNSCYGWDYLSNFQTKKLVGTF